MKDVVRLHASSGTTGKQIVVGYTQNDLDVWADCCARAIVAAGGGPEDIVHVSYGYGLFTGGLGMHYGAEKLGAAALPTSSGNTEKQIMLMKDFGVTVLCCTPSYALQIAEVAAQMGEDLHRLPLNRLKIDRAFVSDLKAGSSGSTIAEMIVKLSRMLGLAVIAEGVETGDQLDALRGMGCQEVQGYYFSPPVPAGEFAQLLKKRF